MLFFGAGTGRCGTMALANALNAEPGGTCLHEGQIRRGVEAGEQWLPFLTLQNVLAYHEPERALDLFREARADMDQVRRQRGCEFLGDVAYNYPPFLSVIPRVFPAAKLIVVYRDGRHFVRSAYTDAVPDPMPVGWLDPERELSRRERYVALGRLRPRNSDEEGSAWEQTPPFERNAWLWAETNRLVHAGRGAWPTEQVLEVRFEAFFADPLAGYARVRDFLELPGSIPPESAAVFQRPLNARASKPLPHPDEWGEELRRRFDAVAGEVCDLLGYPRASG